MLLFIILSAAALVGAGAWIIVVIVCKRRDEALEARARERTRNRAEDCLTYLGISCLSENLDAIAGPLGYVSPWSSADIVKKSVVRLLDRGKFVGPGVDHARQVLRRLQEATPVEGRGCIDSTHLQAVMKILDAGRRFEVVYSPGRAAYYEEVEEDYDLCPHRNNYCYCDECPYRWVRREVAEIPAELKIAELVG